MQSDLVKIKKYYGENMMHLARELFPSILEKEGLLFDLIYSKFYPSKILYDDIIKNNLKTEFRSFIYSLINVKTYEMVTDKSPKELLNEAGYNLYECKTLLDIQKFRKYFKKDEELCTFKDLNRLNTDYVFFAIKKNIDEINRDDFFIPSRQDEYGTSVISIQFTKGKTNHLSIKNRYNHSVDNPDATFNNNLDKIIPGLTYSFSNKYNLNIHSNKDEFELKNYYKANDDKFYKYNMEIDNIYYCPDNIIIDHGKVINNYRDKSRYIFIDYFIIDMKEKNIFCYDKRLKDSFLNYYNKFDKVEIEKTKSGKNLKIYLNNNIVQISIDKQSRITYFEDDKIDQIDDYFLSYNTHMKNIKLPSVKKIGAYFLYDNICMEKVNLEKVMEIGDSFLYRNNSLINVILPCIEKIGNEFLYSDERLSYIDVSNAQKIGSNFLRQNKYLKVLYLPNLIKVGHDFLYENIYLNNIYAPNLEEVGNSFLFKNNSLIEICFEKLQTIGTHFLFDNHSVEKASFPSVKSIGMLFLRNNGILKCFYAPKLEEIGNSFLMGNKELEALYLFSVKTIGRDFLYNNKKLKTFVAPNLMEVKDSFLYWNEEMTYLYLENLIEAGKNFMHSTENLEDFVAPNLLSIGDLSLQFAGNLNYIEVSSNFERYGKSFLDNHKNKEKIIEDIMIGGVWDAKGYCLCKR